LSRYGTFAAGTDFAKINPNFMLPIAIDPRLSISMQPTETNWQTCCETEEPPLVVGGFPAQCKEPELKLSLETRNLGDVMIVHCQGRIVYRDEARSLSQVVGDVLPLTDKLVVDLSGVHGMDSAGLGELAALYTRAQESNVNVKWAGASRTVRTLLDLTHLDRVLDVQPSIEAALEAFRDEQVCADC
jgi:anti-anti-sigma factor